MIKRFSLVFIVLLFSAFANGVFSQSLKVGYINTQELIQAMPASDSAQTTLTKSIEQINKQIEKMQVEYNNKLEEYVNEAETMSPLIRQTRESELGEMEQRIQQFRVVAEQDIQQQREKLYKPIRDKAKKAISDVAKEGKYTYIIDNSSGVLVYIAPDAADILPLVKQKLGLQ